MAAEEFADAIALLQAGHRKVEALFAQFEQTGCDGRREAIARQICVELKVHMMVEEEIFYPAFRGKIDGSLIDDAYVEHDGAKALVNDIEASGADEDYYDAKMRVLFEKIERHVAKKERPFDGMFAQCREADADPAVLRDEMAARKKELMARAESNGLPPAKPAVVKHLPDLLSAAE